MTRWSAAILSLGLIAVTLEPLVRKPDEDGFPLSTFPMFAHRRPASVRVSYARGVTRGGGQRELSPRLLGTDEVMQAFSLLQRAVDGGRATRAALCGAIATRVASDDDQRDVVAIQLIGGLHDAVAFVVNDMRGAPTSEIEYARCDVPRGPR